LTARGHSRFKDITPIVIFGNTRAEKGLTTQCWNLWQKRDVFLSQPDKTRLDFFNYLNWETI
jgi:hypothetical protein